MSEPAPGPTRATPQTDRGARTVVVESNLAWDPSSTPSSANAWSERFELGDEIGRGGMGSVHIAFDRVIGREVALKILRADEASFENVARFVREGQITGQLAHPNIPPVYDLGRAPDGRPYFAMKVVRGTSLRARLEAVRAASGRERARREAALPLAQRLEILLEVGKAIAYAHSRGVIHRDLKPDNIMVGEFGEVQVMDWGLAKLLDGDPNPRDSGDQRNIDEPSTHPPPDHGLTRDGAVAGTPAYMAPEQARGAIGALDTRTDVFALGALLYELLALSPPYRGGTVLEILSLAADGAWTPLEARLLADRRPRAPRELVAIAHHALAPDPVRRYATVVAMLDDVRAYLAHGTVTVSADDLASRLIKRIRRHPRAALALASALAIGLAVSQLAAARARTEAATERARALEVESRVARERADVLGVLADQTRSQGAAVALAELHDLWDAARGRGEDDAAFLAMLSQTDVARFLDAYDALFRVRTLTGVPTTAREHYHRALLRHAQGKVDGAIADLDQAIAIDPAAVMYANRGMMRWLAGDNDRALEDIDRALAIDPQFPGALTNRGAIRLSQDDLDRAIADFDRAIAAHPRDLDAFTNRGMARRRLGQLDLAQADFERALAIAPRYGPALRGRGELALDRGNTAEAIADLDRAVAANPRDRTALYSRANARRIARDWDGAMVDYDRAIELDPRFVDAINNRGTLCQARGDLDGAMANYDRAIELDPRCARAFNNRGGVRKVRGDLPGAIADFDQAIALDPRYALAFANRGMTRHDAKDLSGAIADYDRALELDPRVFIALANRGAARRAIGDLPGALSDLDRAIELDVSNIALRLERAAARRTARDLDGALADYDRALEHEPRSWQASYGRGVILAERGQGDDALRALHQAHRDCPSPEMRHPIAQAIRMLGGMPGD